MGSVPHVAKRTPLRALASLWFAAVLLVLLLLAMACATVVESAQGTERALLLIYHSWWFEAILALLAGSVGAALVVRYPFHRRQVGFVMTHTSILLVLAGALTTKHFGIEGRVGLAEGQTADRFVVPVPTLNVVRKADDARAVVDLPTSLATGFDAVNIPFGSALQLGSVSAQVVQYVPDSSMDERMLDDNRNTRPALQVSLSPDGHATPTWLFSGRTARLGPLTATFQRFTDQDAFDRGLAAASGSAASRGGLIKVTFGGATHSLTLSDCLETATPVADTGYSVRVLRYLPHATVGPGNRLVNSSDKPVNPAAELELVGPGGSERRVAFSRFPDYGSMHGDSPSHNVKVTFVAPTDSTPIVPIELFVGPQNVLAVRFHKDGEGPDPQVIAVGKPIETPWFGLRLGVLRQLDHARLERTVNVVDPPRKERTPAVLVAIRSGEHQAKMWVQKYQPGGVTIDGTPYEVIFADKQMPLGFSLTLNRFQVGYYPGGRRPRSFESQVRVSDVAGGHTPGAVISMNHPFSYGGYTFYQSSYDLDGGRSTSYLSVSRDPGRPVVFTGYIAMMIGMVTVLITRMTEQRRRRATALQHPTQDRTIDLMHSADRCTSATAVSVGASGGQTNGPTAPVRRHRHRRRQTEWKH